MKKITLCFIAIACFSMNVAGQNWKPGVIVLVNGDTLTGDLSTEAMGEFECVLKTSKGLTKYSPDQVSSFYIQAQAYFESSAIKKGDHQEIVFAQILVSGKADLLEHDDAYYLRDSTNNTFLLETIKQKRVIDGKEYIAVIDKYKQILREKLTNCPDAQFAIDATAHTKRALIKVFIKYNECFGIKTPLVVKSLRRPAWYVGLGYNLATTNLKQLDIGLTVESSTFNDKYLQKMPNIFLQFNPRLAKEISFQLSGYRVSYSYHQDYARSSYREIPNTNPVRVEPFSYKVHHDVEYSTFVLPLMLQCSFLKDRIVQPFFGIGMALHVGGDVTGIDRLENVTDNTVTVTPVKASHKAEGSFRFQAGVNFKVGAFLFGGNALAETLDLPVRFIGVSGTHQRNLIYNISTAINIIK
jgi:hypothetical protein